MIPFNVPPFTGKEYDYIRQETSPVDGVCRRKEPALFCDFITESSVGKDLFNTGLGIVEISGYGTHTDILAFLGSHLELLNVRYSVTVIKYHYPGAVNVTEPFKSCFSGISGCGNKNTDLLLLTCFYKRGSEKVREHLKSHVFKCTCRTVPKLKDIGCIAELMDGGNFGIVKRLRAIGLCGEISKLVFRIVIEIHAHDIRCALLIGHAAEKFDCAIGQTRDGFRNKKASVA